MTSNNKLLEKIKEKTKLNKNGCIIWKGLITKKGICRLTYNYKYYFVHNLVWNLNNPDNQLNKKTHKCIRSCNNKKCVNNEHLKIVLLINELSKQDFWNIIIKKGNRQENGCLLWTGYCAETGYGHITIRKRGYAVHRLSYWIHNDIEKIPNENENRERLLIRHLCNNENCFEPTHLKLGSQFENDYDDKIANGTLKRGASHYNASITEEVARKIKLSKKDKNDHEYKTQKQRANEFGVSLHTIKSIDCGKSWAFIPDANGNTSSIRKIKARKHRIHAKDKIWTNEMFEEAKKRLFIRSKLSEEIKKPFVDTSCRLWTGNISKCGYGRINIYGKTISTHILACEIKEGKHKPKNLVTRHLCGNKLCCEPEHMQFGSSKENAIDTVKHGKSNSKLTETIVREIRETLRKDNLTKEQRAKKYNISLTCLRDIEINKSWIHVK